MTYYSAEYIFAHWGDGEAMSNVVLSRYPIVESDYRSLTTTDFWPAPNEQRNVVYTRIDVPSLGPVNFFVTHSSGFGSVDTVVQISEIRNFMVEKFRGDEALDFLVGDLNTPSDSDNYQTWLNAPPFRMFDTYALANPVGFYDSTQVGGEHRIDYILAGEGWELAENPSNYISEIIFDGSVQNSQILPVVSDHLGVMSVFSIL